MTISIIYQPSKSMIDDLELDANVSQQHVATSQVTDSPIEDGASISDHVIIKPDELTITGIISATPIDPNESADETRLDSAYDKLLSIRDDRLPVTVWTPLREYTNMILDSLNVPRDAKTGSALEFSAHFRQVTMVGVEVKTVEVPHAKTHSGTKTAKQADPITSERSSFAHDGWHGIFGTSK